MTGPGHLCTTLPLQVGDGPCEAVVLTSHGLPDGTFEATAVRTWITDLDGSGLEADDTDPVTVLTAPAAAGLESFHSAALDELHRRRVFDFEIADLFVPGLP